jgi:hypothetical protein
MLAKVIGYGGSRAQAALRLERAVHGARVHGVTTNLNRSSGLDRASTSTDPVSSTELTDPAASRFVRPVVTWAPHTRGPAHRDVLRCCCRAEASARTMPLPVSAHLGRQFLRHPAPPRAQS